MPAFDIDSHIEQQIAADDPWGLNRNPFESRRYAAMRQMLEPWAPFGRALEIGCAAGAFSVQLAELSRHLHLVDRTSVALDRATARIGATAGLSWQVADIGRHRVEGDFDAIVASEVLYFVPDADSQARAIAMLAGCLSPNGVFVFGSARDAVVAQWGMRGGAETAMREVDRYLRRDALVHLTSGDPGEDAYIALYRHRSTEPPDPWKCA